MRQWVVEHSEYGIFGFDDVGPHPGCSEFVPERWKPFTIEAPDVGSAFAALMRDEWTRRLPIPLKVEGLDEPVIFQEAYHGCLDHKGICPDSVILHRHHQYRLKHPWIALSLPRSHEVITIHELEHCPHCDEPMVLADRLASRCPCGDASHMYEPYECEEADCPEFDEAADHDEDIDDEDINWYYDRVYG